jgi:hypothetical protein
MDFSPEAIADVAEALHRVTCPGSSCTTVLSGHHLVRARAALEAAAPHIRTDERERIAGEIDPAMLEKLAGWFDADDEFKEVMFPTTWRDRGQEVQNDLRHWAELLRGGDG